MKSVFPLLFLLIALLPGCPEKSEEATWGTVSPGTFGAPNRNQQTPAVPPDVNGGTEFGDKDAVPAADALPDVAPPTDTEGPAPDVGPPPEDGVAQPDVDTYVAVPTDIAFEDPDTVCTPDCTDKVCGPNGCGSICGFCEYGNACNEEGACVAICDPLTPCLGKDCGPDGCGGQCGDCPTSFACGGDGLCYESDCEPQCEGKECGEDGCGGICGLCQGTKLCDADIGQCVSNPCGNVDFKGACADQTTVVECLDGALLLTDCSEQNPLLGCVWNPIAFKYECDVLPDCTPDCSGKQCGDGGCSYSCGDCFNGWSCIDFQCTPEPGGQCGTIPAVGVCIDNKVYFCSNDIIYVEDCTALGKTCQFNPSATENQCL